MLTYCTNIHPAESWDDIFSNVRRFVPAVKAAVSPQTPFPIGLRISGRAATEVDPGRADRFHDWCEQHDCFIATINGFPYGTFHHVPVKDAVYLPDWRHPERRHYTRRLAGLLAGWLPEGMQGSISTVPVGFRREINASDMPAVEENLLKSLEFLDHLAQTTGREISLAMEAEPGCVLETTREMVEFIEKLRLPSHLRPFLTVCYDCCHQALQYESPAESLQLLAEHDIHIGHVQVSSALQFTEPDLRPMQRFCEPCYLHQTVGRRRDGSLVRFDDLDLAIAAGIEDAEEWRIHFHVPVFVDRLSDCASTRPFLQEILPLFDRHLCLEVETYTWTVLPPDLQTGSLTESIIREIRWVQKHRSPPERAGRIP